MKARKVPIHIIVMVLLLSVSALTVLAENRVPVEIPLPNAGFEDLEGDPSSALGKIPYMWNLRSAGSNCWAGLSNEIAYQGKYSLKLVDNNAKGTVVVASQYIPVEPGVEYVVSAQVFHPEECREAKDRIDFYITWWTEDYKRITPSVIKHASKTGEWEEILASGVAPTEAKYLSIWFATVTAGDKCVCYSDNVKLSVKGSGSKSIFDKKEEVFIPTFLKDHKSLIETHPRLYFTEADMPRLKKTRFNTPTYLNEKELTITYYGGVKHSFPLPPVQPKPFGPPPGYTAGDYPYWTALSTNIQTRLESLALSYVVTGDKRYKDTVKAYTLSLAEWDTWREYPVTRLSAAHFTLGTIAVYDMLYDEFTPEERAKIRDTVINKAMVPLSYNLDRRNDYNIEALANISIGLAALTFLGEEEGMERYVEQVKDWCVWYLNERSISGNTEGLSYTSYAMENLIRFADSLMRVTGDDDLLRHPYLQDELVEWVIHFGVPGHKEWTNFSDASTPGFKITMSILSGRYGNEYAGWYLKKSGLVQEGRYDTFVDAVYSFGDLPSKGPDEWPTAKAFNIGWTAMRSGWEDNATFLAFNSSSSNRGHNHMDQNHFILNCNGEFLITDPGYQDYSPGPKRDVTHGSIGHNTLLFDGQGQTIKGGGVTIGFMTSPLLDYVAGDANEAYLPISSGWRRDILYLKPTYFLLIDEVDLDKGMDVDILFRIAKDSKVLIGNRNASVGKSVKADRFSIHKSRASTMVEYLWPQNLEFLYAFNPGAAEYGPYMKVSAGKVKGKEIFASMIHAVPSKDRLIRTSEIKPLKSQVKGGKDHVTFFIEGTHHILYNKGYDEVSDGTLTTDGRYGIILLGKGDAIDGYALIEGERLKGQGQLVSADGLVNVSLSRIGDTWSGILQMEEPGTVVLWVPMTPKEVLVNGKRLGEDAYTYDGKMGLLRLKVGKGTTEVEVH